MQKKLLQSLLVLALLFSGCGTLVPNTRACTAAGSIASGAICAETNTGKTSEMTFDEFLNFLEPQTNPERAGAICQSTEDWNKLKTALEQACRGLGKRCTYEIKSAIKTINRTMLALRVTP